MAMAGRADDSRSKTAAAVSMSKAPAAVRAGRRAFDP
jgi:hypothetical protein